MTNGTKWSQTIMLMFFFFFCPERSSLCKASGGITRRIGGVIAEKIQLRHVCLAGTRQAEKSFFFWKSQKKIFRVLYPLSSLPTALILAQTNHLFQMSRGLCFTHVITVCRNSPQIVATVLLHHLKCYFPPCHPPLWSRQTWGLCTPTSFELFKSATITPRFFCCCFRRDKRPVNLHVARSRVNAGGFGAGAGEGGWSEERCRWRGRWRKRWLAKCRACVCVCALTCLPFTFCLTVWCCCECWRRTCEEPDSGQQNGTPAWVFTRLPLQSLSLHLAGLQLWTHIFSVRVGGRVVVEGETNTSKASRMEWGWSLTWRWRTKGFLSSPNRFAACTGVQAFMAYCLSYLNFSCLSAIIQHLMN